MCISLIETIFSWKIENKNSQIIQNSIFTKDSYKIQCILSKIHHILAEMGWRGLYVGAGSRMMWSGAFSAIGFGTFEVVKGVLGVDQPPPPHHHHQENVRESNDCFRRAEITRS